MNFQKSVAGILVFLLVSHPFFGQQRKLTQENLDSDLRYYYKISKEKNFSANDKLYLLNKLFEKYKVTDLDISVIVKEIEKVTKEQKKISSEKVSLTTTITKPQSQVVPSGSQITSARSVSKEGQQDLQYTITVGDVIYVNVSPSEELSKEVVVGVDGMVNFPLIGAMKASGFTLKEFASNLEKALSLYISNPKITLTVRQFSKQQVFVMGEVRSPGSYQYRQNMKVLDLITLAGGFTSFAGTKRVKIYRGEKEKKEVILVDMDEIMKSGDTSKDYVLVSGDIVEVPRQPKTISVVGAVNNPGNFEWYEGISLLEAVSLARGHTDTASLSSVKIFRGEDKKQTMLVVNLGKVLNGDLKDNMVLEPGDIIVVPRKPLVAGQWFVNTILPWLTLITMTFVIIGYTNR